jgi:hypothetical protein
MNEKTPKKELPGNLNKVEIKALLNADVASELGNMIAGGAGVKNLPKLIKKAKKFLDDRKDKKIRVAKSKMTSDEAYSLKDGGEVKKYMGGGSVQKNKNKMLTTKGWGASRKT